MSEHSRETSTQVSVDTGQTNPVPHDALPEQRVAMQEGIASRVRDRLFGYTSFARSSDRRNTARARLRAKTSITSCFVEMRAQLLADDVLSETVRDNPTAKLEFEREFDLFFNKLKEADPDRFMAVNEISGNVVFNPNTRTVVAMPSFVREKDLQRTLGNYARQTHQEFEIVICLNAGKTVSPDEFKDELEKRKIEIDEIREQYPHLKIHTIEKHYPNEKLNLGNIRALLSEVICVSAKRAHIQEPCIITNDSDSLALNDEYIDAYLKTFERNQDLDYSNGFIEWDAKHKNDGAIAKEVPELLIGQRIQQIIDAIYRWSDSPYVIRDLVCLTINTAYKCSAYMACGGYDYKTHYGEDATFGDRLKLMRYQPDSGTALMNRRYQDLSPNSKIQTSPRRALDSILNGGTIIDQWKKFDEKLGADLSDDNTIRFYKENSVYIQKEDIQATSDGDEVAYAKIKGRVEFILKKSLVAIGMHDALSIAPILTKLGIKTTVPPRQWKFIYDKLHTLSDIEGLDIDVSSSQVGLRYLLNYFGREDHDLSTPSV